MLLRVVKMLKKKIGAEAIERYRFLENFFKIPTSLIIPEGVKGIRESTFSGCDWLKSVVIPGSVKSIGGSAFYGCENLEDVLIQGGADIRYHAFSGCTKLKRVVIPEGVKRIGNSAFKDCYELEKVEIPESVKVIEAYAFNDCKSATIILKKPKSEFEYFGFGVFLGCSGDVRYVEEETRD